MIGSSEKGQGKRRRRETGEIIMTLITGEGRIDTGIITDMRVGTMTRDDHIIMGIDGTMDEDGIMTEIRTEVGDTRIMTTELEKIMGGTTVLGGETTEETTGIGGGITIMKDIGDKSRKRSSGNRETVTSEDMREEMGDRKIEGIPPSVLLSLRKLR